MYLYLMENPANESKFSGRRPSWTILRAQHRPRLIAALEMHHIITAYSLNISLEDFARNITRSRWRFTDIDCHNLRAWCS